MRLLPAEVTVRRAFEARAAGDVARVLDLTTPDITIVVPGGRVLVSGSAAMRALLEREIAGTNRVEVAPQRMSIDGDRVHVFGRRRTFRAGSLADSPDAWTLTLRDGRIASIGPLDLAADVLQDVA